MSGRVLAVSVVIAALFCSVSHAALSDEVVTPVPVPVDKLQLKFEDIPGQGQGYGGYLFGFLQYMDTINRQSYRLCQSRKYFDAAGAALVCNATGYSGGGIRLNATATVEFTTKVKQASVGSWPLLECLPSYTNFSQCTAGPTFDRNPACPATEMVVLKCFDHGALRLVDGKTPNEGRLQILAAGEWWNTCSDYIKGVTADTACKFLGYPSSATTRNSSDFDPDNKRYKERSAYLPFVSCSGSETTLDNCISEDVDLVDKGNGTCYKSHADAALVCKTWAEASAPSPSPSKGGSASVAPTVAAAVIVALAAAILTL